MICVHNIPFNDGGNMRILRLMIFFLCFINQGYSHVYSRYISEIIDEKVMVKIKLDDGFEWEVYRGYEFFTDDRDVARSWNVGDEVSLRRWRHPQSDRIWFFLTNFYTNETIRAFYKEQNEFFYYEVAEIDPQMHYLILNDGSKWRVNWIQKFGVKKKWKVGDKISIYPHNCRYNDYLLFNHNKFSLDPIYMDPCLETDLIK